MRVQEYVGGKRVLSVWRLCGWEVSVIMCVEIVRVGSSVIMCVESVRVGSECYYVCGECEGGK